MKKHKTPHSRSWMKLDNAAKIYPAASRRKWKALFRLSAHIKEPVDPEILQKALESALPRFPGFAVTLKRGLFWYYLEHNEGTPPVQPDVANPCIRLKPSENRGFLFRVRYHDCRIAVEIYHVLTDGSGGLCFLKTLVAEYLRLRYGTVIPRGPEILDCGEAPAPEELEDAYVKYAKRVTRSRAEADAFHLRGTDEPDGFVHIVTGIVPVVTALARAKARNVTLTEFLTATLIACLDQLQRQMAHHPGRLKSVKVNVPINLRRFYPTRTLRNFSMYVNPGIDPKYGEYSFDELLRAVHHHMGSEVTEKLLNAKIATNVRAENNPVLRFAPLFLKNLALKYSFYRVGDQKSSTTLTNLGVVTLPPEMEAHVTRMDFILGPLSRTPVGCAALSYQGRLVLNFTRTIRESALEREFFRMLVRMGIPVTVESNQRRSFPPR